MSATQDESEDTLETEQVKEVPRQGRNPGDIHVVCLNATLQHALEPDRQRERQPD
jgi:hypothetical protein